MEEVKYNIGIPDNLIIGKLERHLLDCVIRAIKKACPKINENTGKIRLKEIIDEESGEVKEVSAAIGNFEGDRAAAYYSLHKIFRLDWQEDSQKYKLVSVKRNK